MDLFGRVFRDHVKETAKFKKECKEIYCRERPDQNKWPFNKGPSFPKKNRAQCATFTKKLGYQRQSVGYQGYKTEGSLVRKYKKKATFFNKIIPQLKKHSKEEIYIKEAVPLPLSGGSLSEIVPLRDLHPLLRNLFPNVKVGNFLLAGRLQYNANFD